MAKAHTAEKIADKPAKPAKTKSGKPAQAKPNVFARLTQYFKDVRSEMRRIVWPSGEEVRNSSIVVIVTLLFFSLLTLFLDTIVIQVLRLIREIG